MNETFCNVLEEASTCYRSLTFSQSVTSHGREGLYQFFLLPSLPRFHYAVSSLLVNISECHSFAFILKELCQKCTDFRGVCFISKINKFIRDYGLDFDSSNFSYNIYIYVNMRFQRYIDMHILQK